MKYSPYLGSSLLLYLSLTLASEAQRGTQGLAGGKHSNGGGWFSATAQAEGSVYVAASVKVLGRAKVSGQVRIEGHAIADSNAEVKDRAVIQDFAYVGGNSRIEGNAVIRDYAEVYNGTVTDHAEVGWLSLVGGSKFTYYQWSRARNDHEYHQ